MGCDFEFAEHPAQGHVLRRGEVLIAQHDNLVLDQGGLEGLEGLQAHRFFEIEAANFRAELDAKALDFKSLRRLRAGAVRHDVDVHRKPRALAVVR